MDERATRAGQGLTVAHDGPGTKSTGRGGCLRPLSLRPDDACVSDQDLTIDGHAAFEAGDWPTAVEAFSSLVTRTPEANDELARARWWLDDPNGAIAAWEDAYQGHLEAGHRHLAARIAVTIAREYTSAIGNSAAANGWLVRARTDGADDPSITGWVELAEAERTMDAAIALASATRAMETARSLADNELEIQALARMGVCEVRLGRVDEGMDHLDAALAGATIAGNDPRILGDVFCSTVEACTLCADMSRVGRWIEVFNDFMERYQHPPLLSFCMICDGEDQLQKGEWDKAEETLIGALAPIEAGAQRARCVHPAALLAEMRIAQSRFEEAAQLMSGLEDLSEMSLPRASLFLARGEPAVAIAEVHRRLRALGSNNLIASPLLELLVQAEIAHGDVRQAAQAAEQLAAFAVESGRERDQAAALMAEGRVAATMADRADARAGFEAALERYGRLEMPLEVARARLEIARLVFDESPDLAIEEARVSQAAFDRIGATRDADGAASFLRELGATGRAGPKGLERLTKREREILSLLGQGLTNAEIAARLFISTKTAAHHVSSVLAKLGVRNRAEAAAYAQRYLERSGSV
jgi:DNA-binding CsgD family transcriptional regulator